MLMKLNFVFAVADNQIDGFIEVWETCRDGWEPLEKDPSIFYNQKVHSDDFYLVCVCADAFRNR